MLLCWQVGELDGATLDNEGSSDDEEHDGDGGPAVRYTTDKEYQAYSPPSAGLCIPQLMPSYLDMWRGS